MSAADLSPRLRAACTALRRHTAPSPESIARVHARLDRSRTAPAGVAREPMAGPSDDQLRRVEQRLGNRHALLAQRESGRRRRRVGAAAALAASLGLVVWWESDPATPSDDSTELLVLGGQDWTEATAGPHVQLSWSGSGELRRTGDTVEIDWDSGRLEVQVASDQGVALSVRTPEGEAWVIGTSFTIDRSLEGTHIEVRHGVVGTRCRVAPEERQLRVGGTRLCDPATATGRLARARSRLGATPASALEDARWGLTASPEPAVASELQVVEIEALLQQQRWTEARSALDTALEGPSGPRTQSLRRAAADLAERAEDCPEVRRHLNALPRDAWTPLDESWHAACLAKQEDQVP
jgi:ferric-dicitrate binding protein FerR (iron transport regulator)